MAVACAFFSFSPAAKVSTGTASIPPPAPKSPFTAPTAPPHAASSTLAFFLREGAGMSNFAVLFLTYPKACNFSSPFNARVMGLACHISVKI